MDYLDPEKQRRHQHVLMIGYAFITIAIVFATWILLYLAYGYAVNRRGEVIQNGLVYVSSTPNPATISLNGTPSGSQTNARLVLPSDVYTMALNRSGYRQWQRSVTVDGGSVAHYDYPFLVPTQLKTTSIQNVPQTPLLSTQSPDRRWMVMQLPADAGANFTVFDAKNPTKALADFTVPAGVVSRGSTSSWQVVEWADDNQHILLQHEYDSKSEYILVDRITPDKSVNLNQNFNINPVKLTLIDRKYDQYYALSAARALDRYSLKSTDSVAVLDHVLAYKSYGSDVFFVTDSNAPAGKALLKFESNNSQVQLRVVSRVNTYLLDAAKYDGTSYLAFGIPSENKVYVYRSPIQQVQSSTAKIMVPSQVLHLPTPDYVGFSPTAQFVVASHGTYFGVYDVFNKNGFNYSFANYTMDSPQSHAAWMDGSHLTFISKGTAVMFDFDGTNLQKLMPALPAYDSVFSPDLKYVYQLKIGGNSQSFLTQTALRIPADL